MNEIVPVYLAVEDDLSEAVLKRLLEMSNRPFQTSAVFGHEGFGYLKKRIANFNRAAQSIPYVVLTDLDNGECAPALVKEWLPGKRHNNLIFCVAVREVESWLLADRETLAEFLRIRPGTIPDEVESILHPKEFLVQLAGRSRSRRIRQAIAPASGSTAKVGPDYNGTLISFVRRHWHVQNAANRSPSLKRAASAIQHWRPDPA